MLRQLWNYQVQIVPILAGLFIVELPGLIRRWKNIYYVPIYFSLFPLNELNNEIANYFGDDYHLNSGRPLTQDESEKLRKKIIYVSFVALFIAAIATPSIAGFICSFFLKRSMVLPLLVLLVLYKVVRIYYSMTETHGEATGRDKNTGKLILVYILYLGVTVVLFNRAYLWARPHVVGGDWAGLTSDLGNFVFYDLIVKGGLLLVFATILMSLILDRKLRDESIETTK